MIARDISYDFPQAVYLIFGCLVLLGLCLHLFFYRRKAIKRFVPQNLQPILLIPRSESIFWGKSIAFFLIWIFAVISIMEPKGAGRYPENIKKDQQKEKQAKQEVKRKRKAHEIVFLIDASASMSVKDSRNEESRLSYAKDIADQTISRLNGERASLDAFTSEVIPLVPSTMDYFFLRMMVHETQINEGDTSGTDLLGTLEKVFKEQFSKPPSILKTLILLTDGGDNELETLQGAEKEQKINSLLNSLPNLEKQHMRIFTIGLGSKKGREIPGLKEEGKPVISALDDDLLIKLGDKGRGRYYMANQYSSVEIADNILALMTKESPFVEEEIVQKNIKMGEDQNLIYDLYYQFPLGIAILLLGLVLCLPESTFSKNKPGIVHSNYLEKDF